MRAPCPTMFRVFSRFAEQMTRATYDFTQMASQNIVRRMATLESTFGRSGGMLREVLGTSLRGF
jgi:hypothetical protein